jgi:hypothetical protein
MKSGVERWKSDVASSPYVVLAHYNELPWVR